MSGFLKNRKLVTAVLCVMLLAVTLVVGAVAVVQNPDIFPTKNSSSESQASEEPVSVPSEGNGGEDASSPEQSGSEAPQGTSEEGDATTTSTEFFNRPSDLRAVYITAGVDYLADGDLSSEKIKKDIDTAMESAKKLTMNSVIFDLKDKDKAIWLQSDLPTVATDFDVLEYAISKAREQGLYVYVIFDVFEKADGDRIVPATDVSADDIAAIAARCTKLANSYDIDGILLDDYYNETTSLSYAQYMQSGGGIGFSNYQRLLPKSAFTAVADALHSQARHIQVGMLTEAVWANKSENDAGSVTNASYTTLYSGNADNKSYVEEGYVDFIAVKAFSPTTDPNVPFQSVVKWWGNLASRCEIPMYVVHAADRACTDLAGWTEYDQLTRQLIELSKTAGYNGSAFNSLSRMLADPKNSTTTVVKFFANDINPKHILTELALTEPKQTTYSTFEQSVTFKGASDPNTEVTINGVRISTDANGYFTINKELAPGLNKFTIVHKGKTVVYNITRQVQVLKEISPMGNITVDGGMKVTITAKAYTDAKVYATVGGQTIPMTKVETEGDGSENREISYVRFEGVYTAPAAGTAVQDIGNITVYGESMGVKEKKQGAFIHVNKKTAIEDGVPIQVIADQAETFPTSVLNDYSDQKYYPLPKGALDYAVGDEIIYKHGDMTYSYYILASNLRVYTKDIKALSSASAVDNNFINGMTVESDERYTKVIFHTQQQVSYVARYDGNNFSINFNYTTGHPDDMSLSKNPLFTQASWSGSTVSLRLVKPGRFIGYRAYYDTDGSLVFRFNNPPPVSGDDLSGVKIVVDPGHGYGDPGASGFLPAYSESVINRMIAEQLTQELESRGADVLMLETGTGPKMVVETRVQLSRAANPQLFISIHCNSSKTNFWATGTEVYYFNDYSKPFASYAAAAVSSALGTANRGAKFGYYYVTRDTQYPGVLCETGFLSNEREYKKLISTDYQAEVATGIADAVCQYFRSLDGTVVTGTESSGQAVSHVGVDGVSVEDTLELQVGEAQTLTPKVSPDGANNKSVSFQSDNTGVATVDDNGNVFGIKAGSAVVTVVTDDGEYTAQCEVTVKGSGTAQSSAPSGSAQVAVTDAKLNLEELELESGKTYRLLCTVLPENATNKAVHWESDDKKVATVSKDGTVTALSEGEAVVSAVTEDGELYADCTVTVVGGSDGGVLVKGVKVQKSLSMNIGDEEPLEVTISPSDADNTEVSYTSSREEVAVVDADGVVEAVGQGSADITVTTVDGGKSAVCRVTVSG